MEDVRNSAEVSVRLFTCLVDCGCKAKSLLVLYFLCSLLLQTLR
jgi:hypothetical protein